MEYKKQLQKSEFIKKKYDLLRNETEIFKQKVAVLNEENEALRAEIAESKDWKRKCAELEQQISSMMAQKQKESSPVSELEPESETQPMANGDVESEPAETPKVIEVTENTDVAVKSVETDDNVAMNG